MLNIRYTNEEMKEYLSSFIWEFKIGDNIIYNLDIVFSLIKSYNDNENNYKKPISILCVSVIEAILVDFLERLDSATNHFPSNLASQKVKIKERLSKEKIKYNVTFLDEVYQSNKLRNFGFQELVKFCEEFSLLGNSSDRYTNLKEIGKFRNRVHIKNYFNNFERDESKTFSEIRTQKTIDYMVDIFYFFNYEYSRPYK